ncbi:hypothetical protein Y1Q_0019319 [Alligator mississippiensis]|uniref:Uncharacterized protein n=1 Tax=Alligator mississippiensis TaxID=8496 RepID=A0A151MQR9_ALLMI|nr:hypothetical protein Y1Q_0019319 [Alligator mississippiensis]
MRLVDPWGLQPMSKESTKDDYEPTKGLWDFQQLEVGPSQPPPPFQVKQGALQWAGRVPTAESWAALKAPDWNSGEVKARGIEVLYLLGRPIRITKDFIWHFY